jgi:hypothetical protein
MAVFDDQQATIGCRRMPQVSLIEAPRDEGSCESMDSLALRDRDFGLDRIPADISRLAAQCALNPAAPPLPKPHRLTPRTVRKSRSCNPT